MNKRQTTAKINMKGWSVTDALSRWGRTYDWYHRQVNGSTEMQIRLGDMVDGLPIKGEHCEQREKHYG